jgi:hypothetical protein
MGWTIRRAGSKPPRDAPLPATGSAVCGSSVAFSSHPLQLKVAAEDVVASSRAHRDQDVPGVHVEMLAHAASLPRRPNIPVYRELEDANSILMP